MRLDFIKNIAFLIFINLIIKPFWIFGIDRNVQNSIGHIEYGNYQALFNVSLIFQIILDFGLQQYYINKINQHPKKTSVLFTNLVLGKTILSFVYLAILMGWGVIIGYKNEGLTDLLFLGIMQIGASFTLFFRAHLSAIHHFKTYSVLSVVDRLIVILFCGTILWANWSPVVLNKTLFIISQLAATLITSGFAFICCLKSVQINLKSLHLNRLVYSVRKSIPYAILVFIMSIYFRSDVIFLERLLPQNSLIPGTYSAAFRLLDICNNMTGVLFAGILLPLFAKHIVQKEALSPLVKTAVNLLLPISLFTAIVVQIWGADIMHLLYKNIQPDDIIALKILMWSFPLYCLNYVYSTLLTANNNIKLLIIITAIALVINLLGNGILISSYISKAGIIAASVSFCTQFITASLNIKYCYKLFQFEPNPKWFFKMLIYILCLIVVGNAINQFISINFITQILILSLVAISLIFGTRLVAINSIKNLFKK